MISGCDHNREQLGTIRQFDVWTKARNKMRQQIMSYKIFLLNDDFSIERRNFDICLADIYAFHQAINPQIECPGGVASFVAKTVDEKLQAAMSFFGWTPLTIDNEGLYGLALDPPKSGAPQLLSAIARHVTAGSIIEFIGEDGTATKYVFDGKNVARFAGHIRYESEA
jgi:hypothetical protein